MKRTANILNAVLVAHGLFLSTAGRADVIGASEFVIASNARFPDAAYNTVDGKYLAVYMQYPNPAQVYGRFVTANGAVSGAGFPISIASPGTFFPAVAYNATDNEFLVTWDDQRGGDVLWGQRVRGSDGALLGSNFQISPGHGVRSGVAWNAQHNVYLVVYMKFTTGDVLYRRISNTGALLDLETNASNDAPFSAYPAVSCDNAGQFLLTWDSDVNDVSSIRGQRVSAADGALIGGFISVSNTGRENRSCIAFDPNNSRWMVQFNQSNPGQSYDQYARLVDTAGTALGGYIPIAATENFEGDTQFGGDIAFAPLLGRYFSSFATLAGMNGVESLPSGAPVTGQVTLGTGLSYFSHNNAADTTLNRFLTVWEGDVNDPPSSFAIRGRVYEAADLIPPDPVQNFTAQTGSQAVRLSWTNPPNADFTGTVIRFQIGGPPTGPFDGQLLTDQLNTPGASDAYLHTGLVAGTTYYYTAFAHDDWPSYAAGATASATAGVKGDFEPDGDVDQSDFALLQRCMSGEAVAYAAGCTEMDLDFDNDVDGSDFNQFLPCLNGPDRPPGPGC